MKVISPQEYDELINSAEVLEKDKFGDKFEGKIKVAYAFQEINFEVPGIDDMPERIKPWGTLRRNQITRMRSRA